MPDRPWKAEERHAAYLCGGHRYPANSGGRVDVEGPAIVGQCKHVQRMALRELERIATEMASIGRQRGKAGMVIVKRRAGRGIRTPRLVVMTESVFSKLHVRLKPFPPPIRMPNAD